MRSCIYVPTVYDSKRHTPPFSPHQKPIQTCQKTPTSFPTAFVVRAGPARMSGRELVGFSQPSPEEYRPVTDLIKEMIIPTDQLINCIEPGRIRSAGKGSRTKRAGVGSVGAKRRAQLELEEQGSDKER